MTAPDRDEPSDLDRGVAGAAARREHDLRRANREQRTRERHPRIGGALLALRDAPGHERVWATGAIGEERVAAYPRREVARAADGRSAGARSQGGRAAGARAPGARAAGGRAPVR